MTDKLDRRILQEALINGYGAGRSIGELAKTWGTPYSTVRRILVECGVKLRVSGGDNNRKIVTIPQGEIDSMSVMELAARYGVHRSTIYRFLKRIG